MLCIDNLYTGSKRNIVGLLSNPYFELMRHDITYPMYIEVDEIYNLACPELPDTLSERSGSDYESQRARIDQYAGAC